MGRQCLTWAMEYANNTPALIVAALHVAPDVAIHQSATDSVVPAIPAGILFHLGAVPPIQSATARPEPEDTFMPMAAGLRTGEGHHSNLPLDVQAIVAETISRILTAGSLPSLQPQSTLPPPPVPAPTGWDHRREYSGY